LSALQQKTFYRLLDFSDPELYAWLLLEQQPEDKEICELVEFIHSKV
jgi:succinate dehydrogenase flavin-adding protein (antitoxin of CptAB toxin-antitoxin module)